MKEAIGYMVNPKMADQVASSEPTVGIASTQFTHPNPLHMEKNMTYRLVYATTGIPCSDWTEDVESLLSHAEQRPDFVPKINVVDDKGNVVNPEPDGIHVSLTPDDMKMLDEGMASIAAQIDAAAKEGLVPVINASGHLVLVPKSEAYKYNGNDNEGVLVFGDAPEELTAEDSLKPDPLVPCYDGGHEFLIPKSQAEDAERHEEFERAADAADAGDDIDDGSIEMSSVDFVKVLQARAAETETTTAKDALHDPLIQYQIVYQDGEPMSEWTWDLQSLLRRRDKLQIVMDYAVVIIDENENLVEADGYEPAPDWLRKALDEREQKFEAAADTADQMDKLNSTLPNDEPLVGFIEKEPKCPFGHSLRGNTFGGDALHHSCGCPVLKGEKLV